LVVHDVINVVFQAVVVVRVVFLNVITSVDHVVVQAVVVDLLVDHVVVVLCEVFQAVVVDLLVFHEVVQLVTVD
tara:strand:- start:104 stop:325 length:222 start_codon:yes stop_codon:yes gene_type:complete